MKYAEIEKGVVVNIAESAYQLKTNWEEIPSQMRVCIGDQFQNGVFYAPGGQMRVSAETEELQKELSASRAALQALMGGIKDA